MSTISKSNILITGASGFLGGWLVRRLNQEGIQPQILCRQSSNTSELEGLSYQRRYGDLSNPISLKEGFKNIKTVFHLAGLVAYKKSQRFQLEQMNVVGTKNVLDACIHNNVERLIHVSSVCAIGALYDKSERPLNEESTFNLTELDLGYFETKRKGEVLVREAAQNKKIEAVIVNPSTTYGRGDALKGSRNFQVKVAQGKILFYPPGGVNVIAVEDVIEGMIQAWKVGRNAERYILSAHNLTIKETFAMIATAAGRKPPSIELPKKLLFGLGRASETLEKLGGPGFFSMENAWTSTLFHWFDSSKAQKEFGLKLKPAETAIENSVSWMRDHRLI